MKRRDLIVGILVALLVGGGVLFAKLRHGPVAAGNGPEVDVDISKVNGTMTLDGIAVAVAVEPRPARPFEELTFRFRFARDGAAVEVEDPRVSFNMTMDMGPHDYVLVRDGDTWVARDVVLPKCGSGSRLWFGDLEFRHGTGEHRGRFEINLAPED